jgi:matrixin
MNNITKISVAAMLCVLVRSASVRAGQEIKLTIGHHPKIQFTDSEADQILTEATNIVAKQDGPGDVICDISLERSGTVKISSKYPLEINSAGQFNDAKQLGTNVVVVDRIRYCGGFGSGILGCGSVPGHCFVVVRNVVSNGTSGPVIKGQVWAHEFGHNRGLPHTNRKRALMYPFALMQNRELDQSESQTYATGTAGVQPITVATSDVTNSEPESDPSPALEPIEQVVRAVYPHGLPYTLLKQYPKASAGTLREMLHSAADKPYQGQIAGALCVIGDTPDFPIVKSFIEESAKPGDDIAIGNKEAAMTALGYLLAKTKSDEVLQFLRGSVTDQGWQKRELTWLTPDDPASTRAIKSLKMAAIAALALSGTDEARTTLQQLADQKLGPMDEDPNVQAIIKQAPTEIDKVKKMGLEDYSRHQPDR